MEPKFNSPQGGYDAELLCPNCGFNYLHHSKVEVFECGEDADGLHAVIAEGKVSTDKNLAGNPSSRRHGLSIHFWCEGCSASPVMDIYQHKGNTFVDMKA